jgi:hypothetical protein
MDRTSAQPQVNLSLFFEIPRVKTGLNTGVCEENRAKYWCVRRETGLNTGNTGALEENRAEYLCVRTGVNTAWGNKISIFKHYMPE